MRPTSSQQKFINSALKNQRAFEVDWKASLEDIIFNLQKMLPHLHFSYEGEDQNNGDWVEKYTINSQPFTVKATADTKINTLISQINQILAPTQSIINYDTGNDSLGFILIDHDQLDFWHQL